MGRAASHITLECALQTHPNITIIGEEVNLIFEISSSLRKLQKETKKEKEKRMPNLLCLCVDLYANVVIHNSKARLSFHRLK